LQALGLARTVDQVPIMGKDRTAEVTISRPKKKRIQAACKE